MIEIPNPEPKFQPTRILELNGFKYSQNEFDGYGIRAKIKITTVKDEYTFDLYTNDTNKSSVEYVFVDRRSEDVTSVNIIQWSTKEQDEATTKFINEMFF